MITINDINKSTIKYNCSCGAIGECMFKADADNGPVIIDLQCPMCEEVERLKLTKHNPDIEKEQDDEDLSWGIVVDNRLKEEI